MAVQYAFAKIVTDGLALAVDAADPTSYPGGTTWRDITPNNNSGTISGSVTYSTAYKGGFIFSGPTASIAFPASSANFGTGSFTVEMAFSPSSINGIHWLASKNSGSFPSWGIYLSGSNGSGKLFSEFRISSAVATSISSSTTFTTGSVYQVDVRILPASSASGFYIDGAPIGGGTGSAAGSLTNTGSLFLGNSAPSSSQAFSGSIYATKIYFNATTEQPPRNFNAIAPRFSKPLITDTAKKQYDILVVAGGGGGGNANEPDSGGGGGAGGLQYISSTAITPGKFQVTVGSGGGEGITGQNSTLSTYISFGGGGGGSRYGSVNGNSGGSGGGGRASSLGGSGSIGQGNNGGNGTGGGQSGGGGGGAGAAGSTFGGSGSFIEAFSLIGGSPAGWFAGGGGGGSLGQLRLGGTGGGGTGANTSIPPVTGSVNTGGGGGGGALTSVAGASGGSGIVAIRYNGTPIAIGGEITQSAGYTYHVFRTVGTSSFTIF